MGIIPNKLHEVSKLLYLHPGVYILMQKTAMLNTYCVVGKFLAEQWIRSAWSMRPISFKNQLNCCEVRNVDSNTCSINEPRSSFSIVTRLWGVWQRIKVWFVVDAEIFIIASISILALGLNEPPVKQFLVTFFCGGKAAMSWHLSTRIH